MHTFKRGLLQIANMELQQAQHQQLLQTERSDSHYFSIGAVINLLLNLVGLALVTLSTVVDLINPFISTR